MHIQCLPLFKDRAYVHNMFLLVPATFCTCVFHDSLIVSVGLVGWTWNVLQI